MRHLATALATASLLPLAACGGGGGGGVEALGSVTPPKVDVGTLTPSPTLAASANLLDVTASTDYTVLGGFQSLSRDANGATLYRGSATTAGSQASKINHSPRDGVFTLTIAETAAGAARNVTYQDPAHRTVDTLERKIPRLAGLNYLAALDGRSVPVDFGRVTTATSTAGASSIAGVFYGPDAVDVGGRRITGGTPDQRVDMLGGFNGAK